MLFLKFIYNLTSLKGFFTDDILSGQTCLFAGERGFVHTEKPDNGNIEDELREAVIENYLVRWAGRFGVPASHGIGFKLIDQKKHSNFVVFSYEIFLVKNSGIAQISLSDFAWEGHLDKSDAEKIFSHLLENDIIIRRKRAYYFNLAFIKISPAQLRTLLLELDKLSIVSKVVSRFSFRLTEKFSHPKTISFIINILRQSILKVDTTTLKITHLGGSKFSKSHVFRLLETAGSYNVVKVDPTPVSWTQYSNDLKNQRTVARCLAPEIKILVPGITFALSGVKYVWANRKYQYMFSYQDNLPLQEQDLLFGDKLLQQADNDEELKKFLKIRDRYGYFMPYLKEGILVDILDNIHGYQEIPGSSMLRIDRDVEQEMTADFYLLQQNDFNSLWRKYPDAPEGLIEFIRSMFSQKEYGSLEQFIEALRQTTITSNSLPVYDSYLKNIKTFLRDSYLDSSGPRKDLEHIFNGLLKLYAILRQKEIAIRDLKAGNIFITDDSVTGGGLGLLDFETAVKYATPYESSKIPQPRLGGTPRRGTPSLWFSNDILQTYYGELHRPIYLPDLYAIIEVIYSAVTREILFKKGKDILQHLFEVINGDLELDYFKTKSLLPSHAPDETTYVLESTVVNNDSEETKLDEADHGEETSEDMLEVYKITNNIYWENAFADFLEGTGKNKYLLNRIEITIPPEFAETLRNEIQLNCTLLETQLRQSDKFQKIRQKKLDSQRKLLNAPLKKMTAYKLLRLMFKTIVLFMNRIS